MCSKPWQVCLPLRTHRVLVPNTVTAAAAVPNHFLTSDTVVQPLASYILKPAAVVMHCWWLFGPAGRDVDDDSVIVQLEDSADDAALDSLKALQQQRDLHDCAPLVGSWVSCRLAPAAAASTAAANNVIQQLAAVQVMGKLKGILGAAGCW